MSAVHRSLLAAAMALPLAAQVPAGREATVGMPARIGQLVVPGPELVTKPIDAKAAVVLRIVAVWPHGSDFRYDLEWYGLEAGAHDLAHYLVPKDPNAPPLPLASIPVTVKPVRAPGQIEPNALAPKAPPSIGGYRVWRWVAVAVWVLGLLALLFWRRRSREAAAASEKPLTLADRLRPMVEAAARGDLGAAGKAELERLLLAFWRRRLGLEHEKAAAAMIRLRGHADAGAVLRQLEAWLHHPVPVTELDLSALLAPYRNVAGDLLDADVRPPLAHEARR
jgi:hypothetical protein